MQLMLVLLAHFVVHSAIVHEVTSVHVALTVIQMISTWTTWLSISVGCPKLRLVAAK